MNTQQLYDFMSHRLQPKDCFVGTYSSSNLPRIKKKTYLYDIVSNQTCNLSGQHWFCIYIDDVKCSSPTEYHLQVLSNLYLMKNCKSWIYNRKIYQSLLTISCGQFSLNYFACKWPLARSMDNVLKIFPKYCMEKQ